MRRSWISTSIVFIAIGSAFGVSTADGGGKAAPKKAAAAGSGSAKDDSPKLASITPATALIDAGGTVQLLLRGTNLKLSSPTIRFESTPSRGVFSCALVAASLKETELKCDVTVTNLVSGEAVKFWVEGMKGGKSVVGSASTATFTGYDALLATHACGVATASGELQLHLRGADIADAATVKVTGTAPAVPERPCTNVHALGSGDLVCYVSGVGVGATVDVQLLRKGERDPARTTNKSNLTISGC